MESNKVPGSVSRLPPKPRRLPEIPKDQEAYDVTKVPRKPPRQRPRGQKCLTPDLQRRRSGNSSVHKRSRSLTESRRMSVGLDGDGDKPLVMLNGDLGHQKLAVDSQASLTSSLNKPRKESFSLPAYCGEDAIFNRRCTTCHQRIFPEGEHYVIAQSLLFHVTCFQCSICSTRCDITDYCYVMEHEKFYCLRHYHEMVAAGKGIGDEGRIVNGTGPGAFAAVVSGRRKRKEVTNNLIELQDRRTKLAQDALQLTEAMKTAKNEEEPFLWKHWFDVTYEKIMITRAVTELAYQLKEMELCEEQERLQRKLRRLRKERRGNENNEDRAAQEKPYLLEILNVIEKRDLLLLELEIERRRDDEETIKLKLTFQDQSKKSDAQKLDRKKPDSVQKDLSYKTFQKGECRVL